jgi:hypothetical protein
MQQVHLDKVMLVVMEQQVLEGEVVAHVHLVLIVELVQGVQVVVV